MVTVPNVSICCYKQRKHRVELRSSGRTHACLCCWRQGTPLSQWQGTRLSPSHITPWGTLSPLTHQLHLCCSLASFYSRKLKWMHKVSILNFLAVGKMQICPGIVPETTSLPSYWHPLSVIYSPKQWNKFHRSGRRGVQYCFSAALHGHAVFIFDLILYIYNEMRCSSTFGCSRQVWGRACPFELWWE